MEIESNPYHKSILRKIEDYQKGDISFDELKRIPKEDLIKAMREECHRISSRLQHLNRELGNPPSKK